MSTETAPDSCPFCGAAMMGTRSTDGEYARYKCGNAFDVRNEFPRSYQSEACATAERIRLTRERDEEAAKADHLCVYSTSLETANRQLNKERDDILARVKRLEDEWAVWPDLQREWFGDKYAAMQPLDAVRARIEDSEARVKRLEEESESRWLLAQSAIGSCAEMSSRVNRLEEAGDKMETVCRNYGAYLIADNWREAKEVKP